MTSETQNSFTKDEQWILDLFSASKSRSVSRKVVLGIWESNFPNQGVTGLRAALKSLQDKRIVKVASDGSLSLENSTQN